MADIKIAKLSDFRFDDENANKGTPRGKELLQKSLKQRKFARPTFAAADGTILGGNKTLEAAQEVGMEDAIVIESDGTKPIIHVRTDIPNSKTPEAQKLALEDNRIAELSLNWDNKILGAMAKFKREALKDLWDDDEIHRKIGIASYLNRLQNDNNGSTVNNPLDEWRGMPEFESEDKTAFQSIHIHFKSQQDIDEFANLIDQKITPKTRSIWFPEIEIERYADKRYSNES